MWVTKDKLLTDRKHMYSTNCDTNDTVILANPPSLGKASLGFLKVVT
jgi:hypothetical protein